MGFTIGSQHAATINNVEGDMVVTGLSSTARWRYEELRAALDQVDEELARAPLSDEQLVAARRALAETRAQATGDGDPTRARTALERATQLLRDTGALTAAGVGLLGALRSAAAALGVVA